MKWVGGVVTQLECAVHLSPEEQGAKCVCRQRDLLVLGWV